MSKQAVELWEAWVDLQCTNSFSKGTLFVWGELYIAHSGTTPFLVKKQVQGADPSHLYLDVFPCHVAAEGRLVEVRYSEPLYDVHKYTVIHICMGEDVVVQINNIEQIG